MADNYLQFSEVLPRLTPEEAAWLRKQLEQICVINDVEYCIHAIPTELQDENVEWHGCRAYRDMVDYDAARGEGAGFEWEFHSTPDSPWGPYLWLYAEESADLERVAHLVQQFLKRFRPGDCWSLTYAATCSKPRVGEFGGGAIFVTAAEIKWDNFVEAQIEAFNRQSDVLRLIRMSAEGDLPDGVLDESVHEVATLHPTAINNGGLEKQIEYLVAELGAKEVERTLKTLISFCNIQEKKPDENTPDNG